MFASNGWKVTQNPRFEDVAMGTDRMMEMKKGSRAAGIGKGSAPKKRSNRADETDQDWSTSKIKLKQKQGYGAVSDPG